MKALSGETPGIGHLSRCNSKQTKLFADDTLSRCTSVPPQTAVGEKRTALKMTGVYVRHRAREGCAALPQTGLATSSLPQTREMPKSGTSRPDLRHLQSCSSQPSLRRHGKPPHHRVERCRSQAYLDLTSNMSRLDPASPA